MRTMHPVLKRGGLYWDRDLLPSRAYDERFARIQAEVAASGDDAWLVYGDVERYGALAYFSNFLPRTRSAFALVPTAGAPALLISVGQRDVPAAKTLTWIDDVRPFSRLPRTLVALIEEKGLASARLGLVGVEELLPVKDWNEITAALPNMRTTSRTAALDALRARKDACEIEAIRRSARVVCAGLDAFQTALAPGNPMRAVTAEAERAMRSLAAEDVRVMVAAGEQASLRPADDRILRRGDIVRIYVAAETQRYWSECARTFSLGPASPGARAAVTQGYAALEAMRGVVRAGVAASSIAQTGEEALGDDMRASARAYGFGNGIGLDCEEAPLVASGAFGAISANATLALRVLGEADAVCCAFAETLLVRDDGVEALAPARELIEIA